MNYAVLFAGGIGSRMAGSEIPKQFIEVAGKPILIHTILAFEKSQSIDGISVICLESWIDRLKEYIDAFGIKKVKWIVPGAKTGQQSIYNGLKAVYDDSADASKDIVLVNDGVRPFVSGILIDECIKTVKEKGSCVTICPVPETIVEVPDLEDGKITDIPDRSRWFLSKAPQGFFLNELIEAHNKAMAENRFDCTNSAELMRRYGHSLYTVMDSPSNIKVTTPIDIAIMKVVINEGLY